MSRNPHEPDDFEETEEVSSEQDDEVIAYCQCGGRWSYCRGSWPCWRWQCLPFRQLEPAAGPDQVIDSTAPQRVDEVAPNGAFPRSPFTDVTCRGWNRLRPSQRSDWHSVFCPKRWVAALPFFDYDQRW